MQRVYRLRISLGHSNLEQVTRLIGVNPTRSRPGMWDYELIEQEDDPASDYVGKLLSLVDGKFDLLKDAGITRGDVSVWVLYEYRDQCNLEFEPAILKRLCDAGVALCITCWQE